MGQASKEELSEQSEEKVGLGLVVVVVGEGVRDGGRQGGLLCRGGRAGAWPAWCLLRLTVERSGR